MKVVSNISTRLQQLGGVTLLILMVPPLCWAGNFIVGRAVRDDIPPLTLAVCRWLIASLILLPFAWRAMRKDAGLYCQQKWLILATSITGITGFNSLVYLGLQTTVATNGIILNSFIPLLIALFGALFFGLSLKLTQIAGMLVSFAGVLAIVTQGDPQVLLQLAFAKGDLIIFTAMICWALYTIWLKQLPAQMDRTALITLQMILGLLFLLPFWGWEMASVDLPELSHSALLAVAYVGIFPSVIAYLCYGACVARLGPARAGMSIHLMPVFGAVLSVLLLGETFHGYHLAGILMIFSGIALANRTGQQA